MLQSEINQLVGKTVEIVVTHGDDMVCRVIGKLLFDSSNGLRVESMGMVQLLRSNELRTNYVWFVASKSRIEGREEIPLICYYI